MNTMQQVSTRSFPQVSLLASDRSRGVEVFLIAQLPPGEGDALIIRSTQMQSHHPAHHDALDEPSALLSAPDIDSQDPASLHSFTVGKEGHPFHRHAGGRVFTAVSGSGGALLRFSNASLQQLQHAPEQFPHTLHHVTIPADCLFSVRMAPAIWHQFLPAGSQCDHPAMFALSCHPDEGSGDLSDLESKQVSEGTASIAALTHLLPEPVQQWTPTSVALTSGVATTALSFESSSCPTVQAPCALIRHTIGKIRQHVAKAWSVTGSAVTRVRHHILRTTAGCEPDALFNKELEEGFHHQDGVRITLPAAYLPGTQATALMAELLRAFVEYPKSSISMLMRLRNALVRPMGLRTSSLGCPVSSLLLDHGGQRFANRFPVLGQSRTSSSCAVLLGNNDRHLRFRSCIRVEHLNDEVHFSLATRVQCLNLFGHLYMAVVAPLHRHYMAPATLRSAVNHLLSHADHVSTRSWLSSIR